MVLKVQQYNVAIPAMTLFKRTTLRVGVIILKTLDNVMIIRRKVTYFSSSKYFYESNF